MAKHKKKKTERNKLKATVQQLEKRVQRCTVSFSQFNVLRLFRDTKTVGNQTHFPKVEGGWMVVVVGGYTSRYTVTTRWLGGRGGVEGRGGRGGLHLTLHGHRKEGFLALH